MKHIALKTLVAATVCLTAPAMAKTQQLTEPMVRDFVYKTEALVRNNDIDGFSTYLSDDAKISLTFNINDKSMPVLLTKDEYIKQIKASIKQASNYSYSVKLNDIQISDDTAYVFSTVTENLTINSTPITSTASEKSTVKIINGKLKMTALTGVGTLKVME